MNFSDLKTANANNSIFDLNADFTNANNTLAEAYSTDGELLTKSYQTNLEKQYLISPPAPVDGFGPVGPADGFANSTPSTSDIKMGGSGMLDAGGDGLEQAADVLPSNSTASGKKNNTMLIVGIVVVVVVVAAVGYFLTKKTPAA